MLQSVAANLPQTAPDDPRVGHLIGRRAGDDPRVVLVGFPSDEGVRRNGGRVGAAGGPAAIREMLFRMTPDARNPAVSDLLERTVDLGDVVGTGALEDDQQALGDVLGPYLARGVVALILGGGHETAFGHFLGYVQAAQPVNILNWDAHADVRPLRDGQAHSGSPFRQALEHSSGLCRGYSVAGLQPQSVARAHLDVIDRHAGRYHFADDLDRERVEMICSDLDHPTLVTFDLDAVDAAFAPGVSAPAAGGLTPALWLHAAYHAGRSPHVRSMDVAELNPRFDLDGRTARLAALTIWHFLRGLSER